MAVTGILMVWLFEVNGFAVGVYERDGEPVGEVIEGASSDWDSHVDSGAVGSIG
jgi:hypothetical protein